jgi:hypothetical protein
MWTTEYSATTPLPVSQVWSAFRGLHMGELTHPGADLFEPHGPFAIGTELSVTPDGQETMLSTIVQLDDQQRYADITRYGALTLLFEHTFAAVGSGTRVTHRLEIDGDGCDEIGPELGPQISGDFDETMVALFALAALGPSGR